PLIYALAGLGAAVGSASLFIVGGTGGDVWPTLAIMSILVFIAVRAVSKFIKTTPAPQNKEINHRGFFSSLWGSLADGIGPIIRNSYLLFGIFFVSTIYEIVNTILDFQMNKLAAGFLDEGQFANFEGWFGVAIASLQFFLLTVFGVQKVLKRFSPRVTLMFFPVATFIIVASLVVYTSMVDISLLRGSELSTTLAIVAGSFIIIRGFAYAVNNPAKELLWIPTSRDIKLKSKGWIDGTGARLCKLGGSAINDSLKVFARGTAA